MAVAGEPLASIRGLRLPEGPPLDLDVHAGEVVRIVGPNGSGKTSVLRLLAGLDAPLAADAVRAPGGALAPQEPMDALVGLTVAGEFRLRRRALPPGLRAAADQDVAILSSGEARRVGLETVRGRGPLLLLDEPAEGLDASHEGMLLPLARATLDAGGAVVVVDHDDALTATATRTVRLGDDAGSAWTRRAATDRAAPSVLHRAAATVRLGDRILELPALDLGPGFHALVGRNGSGKTTLLRRCLGLDGADGVPGARMLPARSLDLLTGDRVRDALHGADDRVMALVPADLLDRHPLHLSGGEARRVALARTLGTPAPVYLLDEPEAHLDHAGRSALFRVLDARLAEGACILAATHDPALAAAADTVVAMEAP